MSGLSFSINESTNKYLSTLAPPTGPLPNSVPVPLDIRTIMSTDQYTTFCSPSSRNFKARRGFLFNVISDIDLFKTFSDPSTYVSQVSTGFYGATPSGPEHILNMPEQHKLIKPNIDKLYLYSLDVKLTESDPDKVPHYSFLTDSDAKIETSDDMYKIILDKDVHLVQYDERWYWEYSVDKLNGHPKCIFFTSKNNFMTLVFPNGVKKNIFIDTNPLKLYKLPSDSEFDDYYYNNSNTASKLSETNSGNSSRYTISDTSVPIATRTRMLMNPDDYIVTKPYNNYRLYRVKPGVLCCMCKYFDDVLFTYKEGEPVPEYILVDYQFESVQFNFKDKISSFRYDNNMCLITLVVPIPKIALYSEEGATLLPGQDYYIQTRYKDSFEYELIGGVKCRLIDFDGKKLWSFKEGSPHPTRLTYHPDSKELRLSFTDNGYALFNLSGGNWVLKSSSDNVRQHL
ncbi:hypothetical protein TpMuguga_03g00422 [Theileria parva strain Muguga]|uniref:uncharacterized protein n=1 Tax=Theileria parva strain Muguga TaxID=333668 RepID=UPI001C6179C5|nr:uncharacterized protein TpMuguga_03g00422 [Theileria parva strain Muguga]EAN31159.2 hypothetical protein TpMuguga_03g00422 [Theileria parva strain Muguga]